MSARGYALHSVCPQLSFFPPYTHIQIATLYSLKLNSYCVELKHWKKAIRIEPARCQRRLDEQRLTGVSFRKRARDGARINLIGYLLDEPRK